MPVNEESSAFSMGQGCPTHGDEHMKECTMCGTEFCRICLPKSTVCPDCSEQDEDEDEEKSDFDDTKNLGDAAEDEGEPEKEEETEEKPPSEDLMDEDGLRQL